MRKWRGGFVALALLAAMPLAVANAPAPASEVSIDSGAVVGFAHEHDTYAWLGIPYAAAPVGELRWRAPQQPSPWSGVREALAFGPACIQPPNITAGDNAPEQGNVVGSEDCLSINVFAPRAALRDGKPRPVMYWIHGGGNVVGSAQVYGGAQLAATQDVVFVSINYRMGLLGWFRHPALRLPPATPADASGNYGTLDIIAGLQWVQRNIASFGGDPDRVTVFGESAGGRNTWSMVQSPMAKGLFHRAIVQSGSLRTAELAKSEQHDADAPDYPAYQNNARDVLNKLFGAEQVASMPPPRIAARLRELSPSDLYDGVDSEFGGMYLQPKLFRDGVVLPRQPALALFRDPAAYNRVPIITGTNRDEDKLFMMMDPKFVKKRFGFLPTVIDAERYNKAAAYAADYWRALSVDAPAAVIAANDGAPVYAYRFDWDELAGWPVDLPTLLGAAHALEIPFVFGSWNDFLYNALAGFKRKSQRAALSGAMQSYWGEFAHTGDPGRGRDGNLPAWTNWQPTGEHLMVFDSERDGGVRMVDEPMSIATIKARMATDPAFTQAEKCEAYRQIFLNGYQTAAGYSEAEYRGFGDGGCN